MTRFFAGFEQSQITTAYSKMYQLVSHFSELLISEQKAIYGIKPLMKLLNKMRSNNEEVCGTINREFAKLCIKAKCYQHSLSVVQHSVTSFKKATTPMDIICYIYYKGLIFTALNRLDEAIEQFKIVISFPTNCTHKIHHESYKKLMLLSLIKEGKMP